MTREGGRDVEPVTGPGADGAEDSGQRIAVIGMACRFPGASTPDAFWRNLREGRESIRRFSDAELREAGVPAAERDDPAYVPANGVLDDVELFDAAFFGFSPLEASITDPQHRLFLEVAWQALEDAGYHPGEFDGRIGVVGGAGPSSYLLHHLLGNADVTSRAGPVQLSIANNKDHVPTRVSYKLGLTGPSLNVNTACSSSLVAVHLAGQSLLDHEADLVLAGGVGIQLPQDVGYRYESGGIASPDGHCRPFDAAAAGTVNGNGVGIVALRRLDDALADRDHVRAVILGSAVNNDGAAKVGYTAPSVQGQTAVILDAHAVARVEPRSIQYVETHGTGTAVGDPIEIAALTGAFGGDAVTAGGCAIGSVKSNIGHLDEAAGVAGLIKTVLALEHGQLPPSLHFERPNPEIAFTRTPFVVNASLRDWEADGPRRAGVSSFGIGGTNAHVVLEEAPPRPASADGSAQLLVLSARSPSALDALSRSLGAALGHGPAAPLADVAFTLQQGRRRFAHRRAVVCAERDAAVGALTGGAPDAVSNGTAPEAAVGLVALFPGQGAQYPDMARGLDETEPVFRAALDRCAVTVRELLGVDLRTAMVNASASELADTRVAQPVLFAVEFALTQLWRAWGVEPTEMLGHSLGEYVAATVAEVFSLEHALRAVCARARLMSELPGGRMLAVPLAEAELDALMEDGLEVAAINAPERCVVAGSAEAVERARRRLAERDVEARVLATSHAFHTSAMEPMLRPFAEVLAGLDLHPPRRIWISNVTGRRIEPTQATDPEYWVTHVRRPVRFADGAAAALDLSGALFLEVGPGRSLVTLVRKQPRCDRTRVLVPGLDPADGPQDSRVRMLGAAGRLWTGGLELDWAGLRHGAAPSRVPLPTYPFERQRYWVEPSARGAIGATASVDERRDLESWFYLPGWKRALRPTGSTDPVGGPIILLRDQTRDQLGVATSLGARWRQGGRSVVELDIAAGSAGSGRLCRGNAGSYRDALGGLATGSRVIDCSLVGPAGDSEPGDLLHILQLGQALARVGTEIELVVVAEGVEDVTGAETLRPDRAMVRGPLLTLPQEHAELRCRLVDVSTEPSGGLAALVDDLIEEIDRGDERFVAWRTGRRWVPTYESVPLPAPMPAPIRAGGVYLITGGLGGIGLILARDLARRHGARLALTGRSAGRLESALGELENSDDGAARPAAPSFDPMAVDSSVTDARRELGIRGLDDYPGFEQAVARFCDSHLLALLAGCGLSIAEGRVVDRRTFARRVGVVPELARLWDFVLDALVDDGLATSDGEQVVLTAEVTRLGAPSAARRALLESFPEFGGLIELLDHCLSKYPAALTGAIAPISVLYPDGEATLLEQAAARTVAYSTREVYTRAVRDLLVRLAAGAPGRRLRVLEIGVGDGLLAGVTVPALQALEIEYHATDVGGAFVARAKRAAADGGFDCVRTGRLDITQPTGPQGYEEGTFDAVVALDVFHATPQLQETVAAAHRLLAPGGIAAIIETVAAPRWVHLIWGLTEAWWSFRDAELRPRSPLIALDAWVGLFEEAGFERVRGWPDRDAGPADDYGLVIGVRAEDAPADVARSMMPDDLAGVRSALAHQMRTVRAMRRDGAELLLLEADAADMTAMRAAVDATRSRFGRLDGVIHAAGDTRREVVVNPVESTTPAAIDAVCRARVEGTRALAAALDGLPLDFIVLISSNASVLGGLGLSAYAAACRFMDTFAAARARDGDRRWTSTNWDGWPTEEAAGLDSRFRTSIDRYAMTLEESYAAFVRVLGARAPQVIVSAVDLGGRLRQWVASSGAEGRHQVESATAPQHRDPGVAIVAPQTDTERALARIWEELLGVVPVGVEDVFADLGGDSLLGTQLITRVERLLGCRLPFRSLFEEPTVRLQAARIDALLDRPDTPVSGDGDEEEGRI